jgi:VCBS repeat-containing protein
MNARRTAAAVLAASLMFALSACGDDKKDTASQPTPTVEATPSAEASSSASPDASAEPSDSASPGASSAADQGTVITIKLVDGKPSEKLPNVTINKGDKVTLVITSDKDYEVHVHATDTAINVTAGQTVTKTLTVDAAPGTYEVEVEDTGFKLFSIVVK